MKKAYITSVLVILLSGIFFTGCKKERTCDLNATNSAGPGVDMTITYKAEQSGDGEISSLTYLTGSGAVTVTNPSLPWTISVEALATQVVGITATGTTKKGSLTISYEGMSGGNVIYGSDFCNQE